MLASYARDAASNNEEYPMFGVPVGPHTNGVLHDHVVGYKVDLDIAGTSNSFQTTSIKYGTYEEATGKTKPAYISYNSFIRILLSSAEIYDMTKFTRSIMRSFMWGSANR